MAGDQIDTFGNTTPAINQVSQIETSTCHKVSYSKSWYTNPNFSGYADLLPNVYDVCTVKNAKINRYLPESHSKSL